MSGRKPVQFSDQEALLFHSAQRPGKLEIIASKSMATQRDLSLAYSPGVAVPETVKLTTTAVAWLPVRCKVNAPASALPSVARSSQPR